MFKIATKNKIECKHIKVGEYNIEKFRINVETGEFAGVWIPIIVRSRNICFKVSVFCNSGFGYIDIHRSKTPLISLPLGLLLLKKIIQPHRALQIVFRGDEIFELDNIKHVYVSLDYKREKTTWVKAEVYGNTKLPGKVIINLPLMKRIGVGFRSEDWEERLWYFLDKPDAKRKSVKALHFIYEILL